jgi:hypothetical protein
VQQTLHGYDRGHHLLAGSAALASVASRRLQIATDLSGPAVAPGFESYLTGFPLDESFYALARTWYADEMPRPGCVWTHTLLLRIRDLPRVRRLALFLRYFRRPTVGEPLDMYARPLSVDVGSFLTDNVQIDDRVRSTIATLYSTAECPIVAPSKAAVDFDAVVLALWQIHPTWLRRTFSFCTGALSLAAADTARDLLVVPDSLARRLRNEVVVVPSISEQPPWVQVIIDQVARPFNRPNLRFFASDIVHDRTGIRKVAEVMAAVRAANAGTASVSSVLQLTADQFPTRLEARQLKTALLDTRSQFLAARPADRLRSVLTSDAVLAAFAPQATILAGLIHDAHKEEPYAALRLVQGLLERDRNHKMLPSILASITARELIKATNDVVIEALRVSAKHSRSGELWTLLGVRGDDILRAAVDQHQRFPVHRWADVLTGVLTSGAEVIIQRALLDLMPTAIIRDVLARTPLTHTSAATRESLLAALSARPLVLNALIESAPTGDWIELAVDILYSRPAEFTSIVPSLCRLTATGDSKAASLHPFLALFGMREADIELVPCILRAAIQLRRTLADKPTPRLQELANRELPSIGRNYDWDLCERLCQGITYRFVDGYWPRDLLFTDVEDAVLFRSIVRIAAYSKAGRRWLDRVRQGVLMRRIQVAQWQRRVVFN